MILPILEVLHFKVTEHPTAAWTCQQIVEAFPIGTRRGISCAIGIAPTATRSVFESRPWALKNYSPHPGVSGRTPTSNA